MTNNLPPNPPNTSHSLLAPESHQDELDFTERPSILSVPSSQILDEKKDITIRNSGSKDSDANLPFKQNLRLQPLTFPSLDLNRNESSTDSATPNWQDSEEKA